MNGSLLNILQSMPSNGGVPLMKGGKGAAASESDGIGFEALLAGLLPVEPSPDRTNVASPDGDANEQTNVSNADTFGNLMSLTAGSPLLSIASNGGAAVVDCITEKASGILKLQPVELVPDDGMLLESDNIELTNLLESVEATLKSYTSNEDEASSEIQRDPKTAHSLELKIGDRSITVPVLASDITDSEPKVLSILTDGRLTIGSTNDEMSPAKDLTATLEKLIPVDIQKSGDIRPEVTVRQVITVADPQTFVKQYIGDLIPLDDRGKLDPKEAGVSGKQNPADGSGKSAVTIKSASPAQAFVSPLDMGAKTNRQPLDTKEGANKNSEEVDSVAGDKLNLDKLVRLANNASDPVAKDTAGGSQPNIAPQSTEMSIRPTVQTVPLTQYALSSNPVAQDVPTESVGFKLILPDAQMKIADMSTFKISIQPESLGEVKVHLAVINDHLTARLSVESSAAKHLVEAHLPTLRETLHQHGIKVESFAVNVADRDNPNRQFEQKREPLSRKSKGAVFSLDSYDRAEVPVTARSSMSPGANLSGQLNLVA